SGRKTWRSRVRSGGSRASESPPRTIGALAGTGLVGLWPYNHFTGIAAMQIRLSRRCWGPRVRLRGRSTRRGSCVRADQSVAAEAPPTSGNLVAQEYIIIEITRADLSRNSCAGR